MNNAAFVVVVLTNPEQVEPIVLKANYNAYPKLSSMSINLQKPEEVMDNICRADNISCYSLLSTFLEYKNMTGIQLHYYQDGYWTKEGHALAANAVAEYLKEKINKL